MSDAPEPSATLPDRLPGRIASFTPVPRKVDRSNGWKPEVQRAFIEALADTGSVASACKQVRRSTVGAYYLRRQPGAEEFAAAWTAAVDLGMQRVEDVAMDRALNGVEVPVYSYGELVGSRTVYNDRLLMFMLRNRAPERFTEGRAKALNAVGKMEMERLKKQWRAECRKEWEAERRVTLENEDALLDEIDAKLDKRSREHLERMSPRTRALWNAYEAAQEEDDARGYVPWLDPDHAFYVELEDGRERTTGPYLRENGEDCDGGA